MSSTTTVSPEPSIVPGRYRHYKGMEYQVIGLVRHSESEEYLVLYKMLYGDYSSWVRPYSMFIETVEVNGATTPRFELVEADAE